MTFEFSDQQVAYLLQLLATRPWGESNEIIVAIQRQAQAQSQVRAGNGNGQAMHHLQPISG